MLLKKKFETLQHAYEGLCAAQEYEVTSSFFNLSTLNSLTNEQKQEILTAAKALSKEDQASIFMILSDLCLYNLSGCTLEHMNLGNIVSCLAKMPKAKRPEAMDCFSRFIVKLAIEEEN